MCGCETGCAWLSTPRFGVRKAPRHEAHTRNRFSLNLYFRACAPRNVFRHGHGHVRAALTSPLGLLLRPGGPAPVRTCKLQSSVMAEIRNGEGQTLHAEPSSDYLRQRHTTYTQRRPFLHTRHDRLKAGARFVDQSKNGATGPEIRVRWGGYHAGNAGESRLAVGCHLDDPLPTCAKTRNRQLHHQSGLISGN